MITIWTPISYLLRRRIYMDKQKENAIRSIQELIEYLNLLENTGNLTQGKLDLLKNDKEALDFLIVEVQKANSKRRFHEIFRIVDDSIKHTFGEYVGEKEGYILAQKFTKMWHSILDLL
jgi:hypothetical protein